VEVLSSNGLLPPGISEPGLVAEWARAWLAASPVTVPVHPSTPESVAEGADVPTPPADPDASTDSDSSEVPAGSVSSADSTGSTNSESSAKPAAPVTPIGPVAIRRAARQLSRHERALGQIEEAEVAARRSARQAKRLRSDLAEAGPAPTTAAEAMRLIVPTVKQVLVDVGSALPIAVVGEFESMPDDEVRAFLGALEEVADQAQIVVVSSHPEMSAWVAEVGLARAALAVVSASAVA
jgi:phosphohistidine phosphatase SixA